MSHPIASHYRNLICLLAPALSLIDDDVIDSACLNEATCRVDSADRIPSGCVHETRNPPHADVRRVLTRTPRALRYCSNPTPSGHKITTATSFDTATHCSCQLSRSDSVPIMNSS